MITILRGPRAAFARHPALAQCPEDTTRVRLYVDDPLPAPWAAARHLLAILRQQWGDAAVEAAIAPNRALLSLVLRGLTEDLSAEERRERKNESAIHLGSLPNTLLNPRPLMTAWAECLARLIRGRRVKICVPDLSRLDAETIILIRPMLHCAAETGATLSFVLGHDPEVRPATRYGRIAIESIERELPVLQAVSTTRVETISQSAADGAPPAAEARLPVDALDDDLEHQGWQALRSHAGPLSPGELDLVVQSIREAFGSFGFPASLELALEVLERHPDLPEAAELHSIAALSAQNYRGLRGSGRELNQLAQRHFEAAFRLENDPTRRTHLYYRLCVLAARAGKFAEAVEFADRAIEVCRSGALPPGLAPYVEAWAHNSRALALYRSGNLDEAVSQVESARTILLASAPTLDVSEPEINDTCWHFLHNLTRVNLESGNRPRALYWQHLLEECAAKIPGSHETWHSQLSVQLNDNDLAGQLRQYAAYRAEATRRVDPPMEALWAQTLGEIHYRLGNAKESYENFREAWRISNVIGFDSDVLVGVALNRAVSAYRAGLLDESESAFQEALQHPLMQNSAGQAEIMGALAMVAAKRADGKLAAHRSAEASAMAQTCEESDVRLRVARSVAEAHIVLGQLAEARALLTNALKEADCGESGIPPEDVFGVLAALEACGNEDAALTVRALLLSTDALEDANAWWDLARVVPKVRLLAEDGQLPVNGVRAGELRAALQRLLETTRQREDLVNDARVLGDLLIELKVEIDPGVGARDAASA